jgi:hypothetical protein
MEKLAESEPERCFVFYSLAISLADKLPFVQYSESCIV